MTLTNEVNFVNVTDVYATDDHDVVSAQASLAAASVAQYSAQQVAHSGLNTLSDAAGQYQPATTYDAGYPSGSAYAHHRSVSGTGSQQHNNIGFLLNPPKTTPSSVIDPNLEARISEDGTTADIPEHTEAVVDDEDDQTEQQVAMALKSLG